MSTPGCATCSSEIEPVKCYASLARNILLSNGRRLPFPYKLTFAVTYRCNYRCRTCNIWQRKPEDELTFEEIGRFFARSNRFNWIDFTGGEPWLRRDFADILDLALTECRHLLLLHFPTNGYLTDQVVAGAERVLRRRPPKFIVTVSMDGDEALNDEIRGREGGWRRQIETYKRLHALRGVDVVLGMTLSSLNAGRYAQAFAAARAECPWLTPRDYHLNIAHRSSHYYGNESLDGLQPDKDAIIDELRRYRHARGIPRSVVDLIEHRYLLNAEPFVRTGLTPMRCHALRASCFLDSSGNVYPCSMYDAGVANLRDHGYDLGAIWNLPAAQRLQREIWDYRCPQCWTPCEAYQSLLGNLLGIRARRTGPMQPPSA
jgi:Fe-coproporphyrin III synthase